MSSINETRAKSNIVLIPAVCVSAAAAFLIGQTQDVQAGVFEQNCNGKVIAIGSGTLSGVPLHDQAANAAGNQRAVASSIIEFGLSSAADTSDVSAGVSLAADGAPPSLCADPPAETTNLNSDALEVMRRIERKLSLPEPNRLSRKLSDQQMEMREMAADVGLRFAGAPGVRKAKLDTPAFIKLFTTLVHRESSFKPRAVSPVGARGLGQLMPATARSLGVKDSFSPRDNLTGAATYLTQMLDRFGSPELALAAYNAGPNAVDKYSGIPPYRETRQYVADILHEVLREPHPSYVTSRVKRGVSQPVSNVQFTAYAEEPEDAAVKKDAFAAVLTDTTKVEAKVEPAVFAKGEEAKADGNVTLNLAQLPVVDRRAVQDKEMSSASTTAESKTKTTLPSPDLTTLPDARAFVGELSELQRVNRDLAVDTALRFAGASGVEKAGLNETSFATLFVALIRRESSFNNEAVSPSGAKGLGQLTSQTVKALGIKDPFSAGENLEGAAKHFTVLLDEFRSPALALAAYNAGPDIVRKKGGIPDDPKTRQFVADVLYDMKSDPTPDFIAASLKKRPGAVTLSSDKATPLKKEKSHPQIKARNLERKKEGPVLAATITPIGSSEGGADSMGFLKFIGALCAAFIVTGIFSIIADLSGGGSRKAADQRMKASRAREENNAESEINTYRSGDRADPMDVEEKNLVPAAA